MNTTINVNINMRPTAHGRAASFLICPLVVTAASLFAGCDKQDAIQPSRPAPRTETLSPAEPIKETVTPETPGKPAPNGPSTPATGASSKANGGKVEMGGRTTGVTPADAPTGAVPAATPGKEAPPIRPMPNAPDANPELATFAGFSGPKPMTWQYRQPDPAKTMRVAEYAVPGTDGAGQADIIVFQFPGGGTLESNVERWKGQVQGADGKPVEPKLQTFEADGMKVTVAELAGSYRGMGSSAAVPDSILIASMIETDGNPVFVQLAGPSKTVAANREAFVKMLRELKKTEPMK